ncbi:hypothetical protein PCL_09028 [Purpureocillium lilacinum]|uniref:Uncharacterized protein n=1 Tax=Purpureocillium lilacinum TaxID=33203 RepID=A0A2U3EH06_PURLI|nr:hypothetical protein PCL_09028 [Purpureocillium lilacinum]
MTGVILQWQGNSRVTDTGAALLLQMTRSGTNGFAWQPPNYGVINWQLEIIIPEAARASACARRCLSLTVPEAHRQDPALHEPGNITNGADNQHRTRQQGAARQRCEGLGDLPPAPAASPLRHLLGLFPRRPEGRAHSCLVLFPSGPVSHHAHPAAAVDSPLVCRLGKECPCCVRARSPGFPAGQQHRLGWHKKRPFRTHTNKLGEHSAYPMRGATTNVGNWCDRKRFHLTDDDRTRRLVQRPAIGNCVKISPRLGRDMHQTILNLGPVSLCRIPGSAGEATSETHDEDKPRRPWPDGKQELGTVTAACCTMARTGSITPSILCRGPRSKQAVLMHLQVTAPAKQSLAAFWFRLRRRRTAPSSRFKYTGKASRPYTVIRTVLALQGNLQEGNQAGDEPHVWLRPADDPQLLTCPVCERAGGMTGEAAWGLLLGVSERGRALASQRPEEGDIHHDACVATQAAVRTRARGSLAAAAEAGGRRSASRPIKPAGDGQRTHARMHARTHARTHFAIADPATYAAQHAAIVHTLSACNIIDALYMSAYWVMDLELENEGAASQPGAQPRVRT